MDALEQMAIAACYPNGTAAASITGRPIDIAQGWVIADDLDAGLRAGTTFVSIYALSSSTSKLPVPLSSSGDGVIAAPAHGMTATLAGTGFSLMGTPGVGEYATAIVNGAAYSVAAAAGDAASSVMAGLAALIPGAGVSGGGVVIAGLHTLVLRIGAPGTVERIIDRQRQNIMVSTWAPTPADRSVVGAALKVAVAQNLVVPMPDTSRSLWIAQNENLIDKYQQELAYRRDLTVQCQWDTLEVYPAYEVTAVNVTLSSSSARIYAY